MPFNLTSIVDRWWPGHPTTWRAFIARVTPTIVNALRLTAGSVIAYLLTVPFMHGTVDLTGALTALLVMQVSVRGSFRAGLVRVGAVLTGVGIALGLAAWTGLSWWSLGLAIFLALMLARVLRLGEQALETPISAMLILATVATQPVAAEVRVLTTLIGTLVGVLFPLVLPPAVPVRSAASAVRGAAGRAEEVFVEAADWIGEHPVTTDAAGLWLDHTREVSDSLAVASRQIKDVSDLRRWNARALGKADVEPLLASGLQTVDRCLLATRSLFIVIRREAPAVETPDDGFGEEVRRAFAVVLSDVGRCIGSFGELIQAEAEGDVSDAARRHVENLELLRETRAILTELMLVGPEQQTLWLVRGSILTAIDQILVQLDDRARERERNAWNVSQVGLALPSGWVGPRFRHPWQLIAQRRLARRAARSRVTSAQVAGDFVDDGLTTLRMPAAKLDEAIAKAREEQGRDRDRASDITRPARRGR